MSHVCVAMCVCLCVCVCVRACVCVLCIPCRYGRLCEVVDHLFPLFSEGGQGSEPPGPDTFSPYAYWREELPEQQANQEEEEEDDDSQPLGSGRGDPE